MPDPRRDSLLEAAAVAVLFVVGLFVRFRFAHNYVFAGSDSYGYVKLANEWLAHGRYALGPAPEPLAYARPPLYALFVALVKGEARAEMSGGDGWVRIVHAQLLIDVLITCPLVWLTARRLGGRLAGVVALTLVMLVPFTVLPLGAALTECLAMALTTAAMAPLLLLRHRPNLAFAITGALVALSTLLRPDGLLAALLLLPAALLLPSWRPRLIASACAVAAFVVVFAPWPLRNLHQFDRAWALGTRVGRTQEPVANWEGPHHYMASYGRNWQAFNDGAKCMFERGCSLGELRAEGAFETQPEHDRLQALLKRHATEGLTPAVSAEYEALAAANRSAHPLRAHLWLPLRRAFIMWTDDTDEILQRRPWGYNQVHGALPVIMYLVAIGLFLGAISMLLVPSLRWAAAILLTAIVGRTAVLAYTFYCMPRYNRQVMPLGYIVTAVGLVAGGRWLAARVRAQRQTQTAA